MTQVRSVLLLLKTSTRLICVGFDSEKFDVLVEEKERWKDAHIIDYSLSTVYILRSLQVH